MTDREKIMTGLELCTDISQDGCMMLCPYRNEQDETYSGFCEQVLKRDALALLKEQDTVEHALEVLRKAGWKETQDVPFPAELLKEQESENGDWITIWQEDDPDTSIHARCSICNRISERPLGGYCKWCGAKMNQEWGVDG